MKNILYLLLSAMILTGCFNRSDNYDEKKVSLAELERDQYEMTGRIDTTVSSLTVWVLFIPIGGKSYGKLEGKAYSKALGGNDAIISSNYERRKVVIPLLLVNFSVRSVRLKGMGVRYIIDKKSVAVP